MQNGEGKAGGNCRPDTRGDPGGGMWQLPTGGGSSRGRRGLRHDMISWDGARAAGALVKPAAWWGSAFGLSLSGNWTATWTQRLTMPQETLAVKSYRSVRELTWGCWLAAWLPAGQAEAEPGRGIHQGARA